VFVLSQVALITGRRSVLAESILTVAAGAGLSSAAAIWLSLQMLPDALLHFFEVRGVLGIVASLGFVVSGGIWAISVRLRPPRSPLNVSAA
jgi:hypothetical protein